MKCYNENVDRQSCGRGRAGVRSHSFKLGTFFNALGSKYTNFQQKISVEISKIGHYIKRHFCSLMIFPEAVHEFGYYMRILHDLESKINVRDFAAWETS